MWLGELWVAESLFDKQDNESEDESPEEDESEGDVAEKAEAEPTEKEGSIVDINVQAATPNTLHDREVGHPQHPAWQRGRPPPTA